MQTLIERAKATRALYVATARPTSTRFAASAKAGLEQFRIAVASDEGPPELRDAADLVVSGADKLVEILRQL